MSVGHLGKEGRYYICAAVFACDRSSSHTMFELLARAHHELVVFIHHEPWGSEVWVRGVAY